MFEDSLFATNVRRSPQRGLAAVLSFGVQAVMLGALVLIPLFYTDALPLNALEELWWKSLRHQDHQRKPRHRSRDDRDANKRANLPGAILLPPNRMPDHAVDLHDSADVPPPPGWPYIEGATGPGGGNPQPDLSRLTCLEYARGSAICSREHIRPKAFVCLDGVTEGLLIHRVTPVYPKLAIMSRQQGTVLLQAEIGRDGTIQNLAGYQWAADCSSIPPSMPSSSGVIDLICSTTNRWRWRRRLPSTLRSEDEGCLFRSAPPRGGQTKRALPISSAPLSASLFTPGSVK